MIPRDRFKKPLRARSRRDLISGSVPCNAQETLVGRAGPQPPLPLSGVGFALELHRQLAKEKPRHNLVLSAVGASLRRTPSVGQKIGSP